MNCSHRLIVPVTDCVDVAYNEMRASILRSSSPVDIARFIEPVVPVQAFSIINANFVVRLMADAYRDCGLLFTIVNPVIAQPERIIGRTKKHDVVFAGRNNGAFGWLVQDLGCQEAYEIADLDYIPFGGKHVYPPVIAAAWENVPLSEMGEAIPSEDIQSIQIRDGTVVHIDNFGIVKIKLYVDFEHQLGVSEGEDVDVFLNDRMLCRAKYFRRLMSLPTNSWAIYPGSSLGGLVELGITRGNAAITGGVSLGDVVSLRRANYDELG